MFSTCLHCHASLGRNDGIEHFPVGQRLAFDGERGRLWAICPSCQQWNLAPIEERWEALEACEKMYRRAVQRVSSDNIALARLRDGTDLVRIGRPLFPGFAAWRYGARFASRRRRDMATLVAGGALVAAGAVGTWFGATALVGTGVAVSVVRLAVETATRYYRERRPALRLQWPGLGVVSCTPAELARVRLVRDKAGEPSLTVPQRVRSTSWREPDYTERLRGRGDVIHDVLRVLMPYVNRAGSDPLTVREATRLLDVEADPDVMLATLTSQRSVFGPANDGLLRDLPAALRLTFEMSLHEDDERRAMAGELGALYARWEEAERIARIADRELTTLAAGDAMMTDPRD